MGTVQLVSFAIAFVGSILSWIVLLAGVSEWSILPLTFDQILPLAYPCSLLWHTGPAKTV